MISWETLTLVRCDVKHTWSTVVSRLKLPLRRLRDSSKNNRQMIGKSLPRLCFELKFAKC